MCRFDAAVVASASGCPEGVASAIAYAASSVVVMSVATTTSVVETAATAMFKVASVASIASVTGGRVSYQ